MTDALTDAILAAVRSETIPRDRHILKLRTALQQIKTLKVEPPFMTEGRMRDIARKALMDGGESGDGGQHVKG